MELIRSRVLFISGGRSKILEGLVVIEEQDFASVWVKIELGGGH